VTFLNSISVSSSETDVRNGIKSWREQLISLLNSRKLLVVFKSAIHKGLLLHSQIYNLTNSKGNVNTVP
jgi:hypothetical protein